VKPDAERKRDERERMRARGYVLRQVWVHPDDAAKVQRQIDGTGLLRECLEAFNRKPCFEYAHRRTSYQLAAKIEKYLESSG
jgi:hypothetical protein